MAPIAPSLPDLVEDTMTDHCESILVYDRSYKRINCVDENDARRLVAKFIYLLRTHGLDYAGELLRCLLSIPRNLTFFGLHFHIENFGPLQLLGSGGFGTVFKAVHKLDEKEYAIKVVHRIHSSSDLESARSEVSMMARLNHDNIVQYVTSWMEYGFLPFFDQLDTGSSVDSSNTTSSCNGSGYHERRTQCSSLQNETSKTSQNSCAFSASTSCNEIVLSTSEMPHRRQSFIPRRVLFIQLELCQYNLAQWIDERNSRVIPTSRVSSHVQHSADALLDSIAPHGPARWLSDQIVCAVNYLHSMKIMHRDLKPENVLLCGPPLRTLSDAPCGCFPGKLRTPNQEANSRDSTSEHNCYHQLVVKLCDFGLARFLQGTLYYSSISKFVGSRSHPQICPSEPDAGEADSTTSLPHSSSLYGSQTTTEDCDPYQRSIQLNHLSAAHPADRLLTANLGSEIYTAPEVIVRSFGRRTSTRVAYDYKADVFSMGVIFLQLFHPMQTLHELIKCLQRFAKDEQEPLHHTSLPALETLPQEFVASWPEESVLVARMLSNQPSQRPSASAILCTLAPTSEFPGVNADENRTNVTGTVEQDFNEVTTRAFSGHRVLDLLLWRNRQLQRELEEARRRLSVYEASQT